MALPVILASLATAAAPLIPKVAEAGSKLIGGVVRTVQDAVEASKKKKQVNAIMPILAVAGVIVLGVIGLLSVGGKKRR